MLFVRVRSFGWFFYDNINVGREGNDVYKIVSKIIVIY